eukprot:111100_1
MSVYHDQAQVPLRVYRVNGKCYRAYGKCSGCLWYNGGPDAYPNVLDPIPCNQCAGNTLYPTSLTPTTSPTASPTTAPTLQGPTPAPIGSNKQIFLDKLGSDHNVNCNKTFPCLTVEYGYNCFIGNNGCNLMGFNGNGLINLGDGKWYWQHSLIYDNEEVIINGNGMDRTTLEHNTLHSIGCKFYKCWVEINNLRLTTNQTDNTILNQIKMNIGGTLIFNNVLFDNSNAVWIIKDDRVKVIFNSCVFNNNNAFYQISNGATVQFTECEFYHNSHLAYNWLGCYLDTADHAMSVDLGAGYYDIDSCYQSCGEYKYFALQNGDSCYCDNDLYQATKFGSSTLCSSNHMGGSFANDMFEVNTVLSKQLFYVQNGANLEITNSLFNNNHHHQQSIPSGHIIYSSLNSTIMINNVLFQENTGYTAIIYSENSTLLVSSSYFQSNTNITSLILCNQSTVSVINSTLRNNEALNILKLWGMEIDNSNNFVCPSSNCSIQILSNKFESNYIHSIIETNSARLFINNNTFYNNVCHGFCIQSTDSSISIDSVAIDYSFIEFEVISALFKSTLCLTASITSNQNILNYLSFGESVNINNTKVMSHECDYVPFVFAFENISFSSLPTAEQHYLYDIPGAAVQQTLECADTTASCAIQCNGSVSCFSSIFLVSSAISTIHCGSSFSCGYALINTSDNALLDSFHVICDEKRSCMQAEIFIHQVNEFILDCVSSESCAQMTVHIQNTTNSSINCYLESACNSLTIYTKSDNTTLTLHGFSENIIFHLPSRFNENNINCDPQNAFLVISDQFNSLSELISQTFGTLPCSDVHMLCNDGDSCDMQYVQQTDAMDVDKFLKLFSCYGPMSVEEIFSLQCFGACGEYPTEFPTSYPTFNPTVDTLLPTSSPTVYPTKQTESPTFSPSNSPTNFPSVFTLPPSEEPTESPTNSPTNAPTRNPIASHEFDSEIQITYLLNNLNNNDKAMILTDPRNETKYIENVIKDKYFKKTVISYDKYMITITDIDGIEINKIDTNTAIKWENLDRLELNGKIDCDQDNNNINYCESIKGQSQPNNDFSDRVEAILRNHTGNNVLNFSVKNAIQLRIVCKDCSQSDAIDYVSYALLAVACSLGFLSILALLFNKGKFPKLSGFNVVDNASWTTLMIFGLQLWDFYSDIILSLEIMRRDDLVKNVYITIAGFGSTFFTFVPYMANLIIAIRVKRFIKNNIAAKAYFQQNTSLFVLLVVFSGGCHVSLSLVSSAVFGLEIFSSGLTSYEIRKLSKIKVFATVILENIPQIGCQMIYSASLNGNMTRAVQFALIASLLSAVAATLSYFIEQSDTDAIVVQYYLITRFAEKSTHHNDALNDDDKQKFIDNKGRRSALGSSIAEVFGISSDSIEIGNSTITKHGIITHIVHHIFDEDLKSMENSLAESMIFTQIGMTPKYYVSQLCKATSNELSQAYREHYGLDDTFETSFHWEYASILQKNPLVEERTLTVDEKSMNPLYKRKTEVFNRMRSQISNVNSFQKVKNNEENVMMGLKGLFSEKGAISHQHKMNLVQVLLDQMDDEKHDQEGNGNVNVQHIELVEMASVEQQTSTAL